MIEQIKDWNKADNDGTIHVPDHLDDVVNKVGNQILLHTISGKNQAQTVCDIVYGLEAFFQKQAEDQKKKPEINLRKRFKR